MKIFNNVERPDFQAAAVLVRDFEVRESSEAITEALDSLSQDLECGQAGLDEDLKNAVRKILRNGKYRPSGRGKPAQEYLSKIWRQERTLTLINNAVDVNNIISLRTGLPVSAFDAAKLEGELVIRLGKPEEHYVFNASGQSLECQDLIVVCDSRGPIGSPVKDSQATKLFPGARSVLYVVYSNSEQTSEQELLHIAGMLSELLLRDSPEARTKGPVLARRSPS